MTIESRAWTGRRRRFAPVPVWGKAGHGCLIFGAAFPGSRGHIYFTAICVRCPLSGERHVRLVTPRPGQWRAGLAHLRRAVGLRSIPAIPAIRAIPITEWTLYGLALAAFALCLQRLGG